MTKRWAAHDAIDHDANYAVVDSDGADVGFLSAY